MASDERRQARERAAQRGANRDGALRVLERAAAAPAPSPTAMIAMGYLLAEKAYEEARSASWSCRFCELGPPNVFSREAFVEGLQKSNHFRRAIQLFDDASASPEATGWIASFFAMRARRDLGRSSATSFLARRVGQAPPPGVGEVVLPLARMALDAQRPDMAKDLLRHVIEGGTPGARLWFHALELRWGEVLRVAVEMLAQDPLSRARDVLELGVLAAELQGMREVAAGARDGEARIALALAERALLSQDIADTRRWLDWIRERAPESTCAPLALEATAILAEHRGDHDAAARTRAAMAARYGEGSAWEAAVRARLEAGVAERVVKDSQGLVRTWWPLLMKESLRR